jgi:hypothetical protein
MLTALFLDLRTLVNSGTKCQKDPKVVEGTKVYVWKICAYVGK